MTKLNIYELKRNSQLAERIARIHKNAFPDFFLTQLGKNFLTTLYQGYIEDEESGIIVAEDERNKNILGFIAYSNNYSKFYTELKRNHLLKFALCSLIAVIKHPSFFKRLLRAFKKSEEVERSETYVELASIGVLKDAQGKGIGGKLVDYLISNVDFNRYEYINLETDADNNDSVNAFYKSKGFELKQKYVTLEGRHMNEYRYRPEGR